MRKNATLTLLKSAWVIAVVQLSLPTAQATDASPAKADDAIEQYVSDYISDAFDAVATGVAFEPYSGMQRGPEGTALSASGNAIDQAMLMARVLDDQIVAWRLAHGWLNEASTTNLLSKTGSTPRESVAPSSVHYDLYDPINDKVMRHLVRNHYWLEIQEEEGGDWLAMDPSYPGAKIGQSFTKARRYFSKVPRVQQQQLTITFKQRRADGKTQQLGTFNDSVARLSRYPIALIVRGIPQYEESEEDDAGDSGTKMTTDKAGGLLGGGLFGGGKEKPKSSSTLNKPAAQNDIERAIVGTEYRRELTYLGNEPKALKPTMVLDADNQSKIEREWIEFNLRIPGEPPRLFSRDLFTSAAGSQPATIRRYSIAVVAGEMTKTAFDNYRGVLDANQVSKARATLAKLKKQTASNETAQELIKLESSTALTAYLMNLAFAYESDMLSARLAAGAGVRIVRGLPRVLITSIETELDSNNESTTSTTLDLRLDEVVAVPFAGMPVGATALFQRARGMQESALEGRVLAQFVEGSQVVTTTEQMMREAQNQGHQLLVLTQDNRDAIANLNALPQSAAALITSTIDRGHQVIVPTAATVIDGRKLWGWWDVDPASGAFVGVMQSGQHQAMTQYTVTLEKIGVNDAMGYVIGAMVGSTATMTLYSAKMIEYGAVTPQLIQEVAAGIEQLTCVTCPSFEVSVSPISASAGFTSPCFEEIGVGIDTAIGVSGSIDFCENYKLGISCAASLMLGTFEVEDSVSIGPDVTADLGPLSCD